MLNRPLLHHLLSLNPLEDAARRVDEIRRVHRASRFCRHCDVAMDYSPSTPAERDTNLPEQPEDWQCPECGIIETGLTTTEMRQEAAASDEQ